MGAGIKIYISDSFHRKPTDEKIQELQTAIGKLAHVLEPVAKSHDEDEWKGVTPRVLADVWDIDLGYFGKWYNAIYDAVKKFLKQHGGAYPLTDAQWHEIRKIANEYKAALLYNIGGITIAPSNVPVELVDPRVIQYPELAVRLGYLLGDNGTVNGLKAAIEKAYEIRLTKPLLYAIDNAKRMTHGFLSPLANQVGDNMEKELRAEEDLIARRVIASHAMKTNPFVSGRLLGNEDRKQGFLRDTMRVMRTRTLSDYSIGKYMYEKDVIAKLPPKYDDVKGASPNDVLVYKTTNKNSCSTCQRLYTHKNGVPKLYKLKDLEAAESNYGKPVSGWTAQIELVHPNCSGEGGIQIARQGVTDLIYPNIFKMGVSEL